jgi:hypothetical protein
MIKFNRDVTSPKFDCLCFLGLGVVCVVLAVTPPYGLLTAWWAGWGAMNLVSSRRLYLKWNDALPPQIEPAMPEPVRRDAPNRWTIKRNFLWRAPLRGVRRGQHVKK